MKARTSKINEYLICNVGFHSTLWTAVYLFSLILAGAILI